MSNEYYEYSYDGPVMEFGRVIANRWVAKTYAPSKRKARSNLTYQFKKQFGKTPTVQITLLEDIKQLGRAKK